MVPEVDQEGGGQRRCLPVEDLRRRLDNSAAVGGRSGGGSSGGLVTKGVRHRGVRSGQHAGSGDTRSFADHRQHTLRIEVVPN